MKSIQINENDKVNIINLKKNEETKFRNECRNKQRDKYGNN